MDSYFLLRLSIIAPGGNFDDIQRAALDALLKQAAPRRYRKRLDTIRGLFKSFVASGSFDAGMTIVRILKALEGYEPTWISNRTDDFPRTDIS